MKFAHIADCHIGGWREETLTQLNMKAFSQAITKCVEEHVDFVVISGDLFNTALPPIDAVKHVVKELKKLKVDSIPCYTIAGSHDFSPSGKTMLAVLEEAGLCKDVVKGEVINGKLHLRFTTDKKTGVKITGMIGKRGMLEKGYYEDLMREPLEQEEGFKIFMFHTAVSELKPASMQHMDASPLSLLPKGFDYYAGGHVHIVKDVSLEGYKHVVYPGPLFPNSFTELEKLSGGGFFIYDNGEVKRISLNVIPIQSITISCDEKTVDEVENEVRKATILEGALVTLRLQGKLREGKPSDLHHQEILEAVYDKGAAIVLKSTSKVESQQFEEIKVEQSSVEEIEKKLFSEHAGQHKGMNMQPEEEIQFSQELLNTLSEEPHEGEKKYEFEERIVEHVKKVIEASSSAAIQHQDSQPPLSSSLLGRLRN